jgi:hypothetical protein
MSSARRIPPGTGYHQVGKVPDLTLSLGQEYLVDYLVTVNATPASTYDVSGDFDHELNRYPVLVNDVDDSLGPISACYVMGVPITLPYPEWSLANSLFL